MNDYTHSNDLKLWIFTFFWIIKKFDKVWGCKLIINIGLEMIRNISLNLVLYFDQNFRWAFFITEGNFPRWIFSLSRKDFYLVQVGKSAYSFRRVFKREINKERWLRVSSYISNCRPSIFDLRNATNQATY